MSSAADPLSTWARSWHPLAERFPMLGEEEVREMAASIAEHGQFVACRMTVDGLGLDGRNRVAACALAGVEPEWEVYEGDPIAFIVEVNAERRHLSTGQRAMAVAIGLRDAGKRRNGKFQRGAVPSASGRSSASAWTKATSEAGLVLDHAAELADAVLAGELALDAAHRQAAESKERRERLAALDAELAGLVDSDVLSLDLLRAPAADRNGGAGDLTADWPAVAARLGHEVAVLRRERDALDREVESLRRQLQRAGAYQWDLECEIAELRHDLEVARG